ncbi:hypothetical protein ACFFGV_17885 [Pontibacillus salicampi]|uniref:Uncharacterized protein n=1 Tax=Pontibacillus salicampi TaxID=1449801 RepID=A0ABV6LST1_9BACI
MVCYYGAAELFDWQERMIGNGIDGNAKINCSDLMEFKRTFTNHVPDKKEQALNKNAIDTYHGKASFISDNQFS